MAQILPVENSTQLAMWSRGLLYKMLRKFVTKFVAYFQRILRIPETKFVGLSKFVGFLATNEFVTFYTTGPCPSHLTTDGSGMSRQNGVLLGSKFPMFKVCQQVAHKLLLT